jgi:hypothetical protein
MLFIGRDADGKLLVVVLWSLNEILVMGSLTGIKKRCLFYKEKVGVHRKICMCGKFVCTTLEEKKMYRDMCKIVLDNSGP